MKSLRDLQKLPKRNNDTVAPAFSGGSCNNHSCNAINKI